MQTAPIVQTTSLSTKGQIVIPEGIRKTLHWQAGDRFVVYAQGDTLVLKALAPPSMAQFKAMMSEARAGARKAGAKVKDVAKALKLARKR